MVKREELEKIISAIERRRLAVEEKRTVFQFETAFFMPLFALLFLVTYFSKNEAAKMFLYILTIFLIILDLIYSVIVYKQLLKKQEKLEELIHKKVGMEL